MGLQDIVNSIKLESLHWMHSLQKLQFNIAFGSSHPDYRILTSISKLECHDTLDTFLKKNALALGIGTGAAALASFATGGFGADVLYATLPMATWGYVLATEDRIKNAVLRYLNNIPLNRRELETVSKVALQHGEITPTQHRLNTQIPSSAGEWLSYKYDWIARPTGGFLNKVKKNLIAGTAALFLIGNMAYHGAKTFASSYEHITPQKIEDISYQGKEISGVPCLENMLCPYVKEKNPELLSKVVVEKTPGRDIFSMGYFDGIRFKVEEVSYDEDESKELSDAVKDASSLEKLEKEEKRKEEEKQKKKKLDEGEEEEKEEKEAKEIVPSISASPSMFAVQPATSTRTAPKEISKTQSIVGINICKGESTLVAYDSTAEKKEKGVFSRLFGLFGSEEGNEAAGNELALYCQDYGNNGAFVKFYGWDRKLVEFKQKVKPGQAVVEADKSLELRIGLLTPKEKQKLASGNAAIQDLAMLDREYINPIPTAKEAPEAFAGMYKGETGFSFNTLPPLAKIDVSSPYGMRIHPVARRYAMHTGVDLRAPYNSPIYNTCANGGVVDYAKFFNSKAGNTIFITCNKEPGKPRLRTGYLHLSDFSVAEGQHVKPGQVIGHVGTTGISTGPHLHLITSMFEDGRFRSINPLPDENIAKARAFANAYFLHDKRLAMR